MNVECLTYYMYINDTKEEIYTCIYQLTIASKQIVSNLKRLEKIDANNFDSEIHDTYVLDEQEFHEKVYQASLLRKVDIDTIDHDMWEAL